MSTESQTPPTPADAPSPVAAVKDAWGKFKRGELVPYKFMAALLVVATLVGLFIYMSGQTKISASKMWVDLESASTTQDLEKIMTDYPNSPPAQLAEFHLARIKLGPDGIDKLVTPDQTERQKALSNIEAAKESFNKLAPEMKDSPVLQAECYLGLAKAEVALIGITREGRADPGRIGPLAASEFRGSPAAAAEWLEKFAGASEGTPWGDEAKKQAADLRGANSALAADIQRVQTNLYNMTLLQRPGMGSPFGPGGGFPIGPGGFPALGGPMGGIPGMPGGGLTPPLPPGHP